MIVNALLARPREWTVAVVRDVLIPFMAEPGGALAHGQRRDVFYNSAVRHILDRLPAITPDTSAWTLSPAVFDYLAQQGRSAVDPRLRDLGLLSLFARDPQRYSDSVRARAQAGSTVVEEAALMIDGATAYAMGTPLPAAGADWRAWLLWMTGPTPTVARPGAPARPRPMAFSAANQRAIRMYEVRTGRDVVSELRRNMSAADSDSARLIYSTILTGLGVASANVDEVARLFISGSAGELAQARAGFMDVFRDANAGLGRGAPPPTPGRTGARLALADSITRVEVADRIVSAILGRGAPLQTVEQKRGFGAGARFLFPSPDATTGRVLITDSLPPAVVERRQSQGTLLPSSGVNARDPRENREIVRIGNVNHIGPFVQVVLGWDVSYTDAAGVRRGGGSRSSLFLLKIDGEWVVVFSTGAQS
jgi:hypothetical protein